MRVTALEAFQVRIPLKRKVTHASHVRTETDNIVVRCVLSDGSIGFGEGVPRDYVTGETIDFSFDLLKRSALSQQVSAECSGFAEAVQLAERFRLERSPGDERDIRGNAARCAVELALLDAYGRAFTEPLGRVAALIAPEHYQPQKEVRYSGIIGGPRGWKKRLYPLVYRLAGFKQVKVKVGIAGQDDVQRLRILRSWLGASMDVRLDANEAWSPSEVTQRIRELEPFRITCIEQPVRHEDVACLAEVRKNIRTPVALDESLCGAVDGQRAAVNGWCDVFNIRLSKCGGFIPSIRLAQLADKHGLGYQLGCQVGETGILSAAGRHFATSICRIRYLEGSYDRHLVRECLTREDVTFHKGGRAAALAGAGLCVTIDPARLAAATVRKEKLIG